VGAAAAVLALTGAAFASTAAAAPPPGNPGGPPAGHPTQPAPHVMTIMLENTDYAQFAGSPQMPYFNQLGHQYADFTNAYGWEYPSLPNYVTLLSGSDQGIQSDCDITETGCNNKTGKTLVTELQQKGYSWNAYYQGDATGCDQSDGSGLYTYWHNAFRYFANFATLCPNISGFGDLNSNLNSGHAADFQWVVPDDYNNGGDQGTMSTGDTWLAGELPQIMSSAWYHQGGQIVILFDTGYYTGDGVNGTSGGHIPMVVVSSHDRGMGVVSTPIDTDGVLHSIEGAYGVPYLATSATPNNGNLGQAMVTGRTPGPDANQVAQGAVLQTGLSGKSNVVSVGNGAITLEGVANVPAGGATGGASPAARPAKGAGSSDIEVGEGPAGVGVVVTPQGTVEPVPGTTDLQSVSCTTSTQCYAVGLGPSNNDDGVLVPIVNGRPGPVTVLGTSVVLYGISCPSATTCYGTGFSLTDEDVAVTITNGQVATVQELPTSVEWLNAISCPTATQCYATGLVNYAPAIVPITNGAFGTPVTVPHAWYANAIDCPSVGNCVVAGGNTAGQGIVWSMVNGQAGTTQVVAGTENLYGVAADGTGNYVLTGAATAGSDGYNDGVVVTESGGTFGPAQVVAGTNGFGQVICNDDLSSCASVGTAWAGKA